MDCLRDRKSFIIQTDPLPISRVRNLSRLSSIIQIDPKEEVNRQLHLENIFNIVARQFGPALSVFFVYFLSKSIVVNAKGDSKSPILSEKPTIGEILYFYSYHIIGTAICSFFIISIYASYIFTNLDALISSIIVITVTSFIGIQQGLSERKEGVKPIQDSRVKGKYDDY